MKRFPRTVVGAFVAVLAVAGRAEDPPLGLDDVFRKVDDVAAGVKDLRADFRQAKKMKIRKRPMLTEGKISVRKTEGGARICWESWEVEEAGGERAMPQRLLILGDEGLMISWDLETRAGERTDLGKGKLEVSEFLTIGGSLSGLKKGFDVTLKSAPKDGAGYVLGLAPKGGRLKNLILDMELEVDPVQWVVTRIRVVDNVEAVTEIFLTCVEINAGVADELYKVPADVKLTEQSFDK